MSGLGFTMVNDPAGRSCKVMLNGTEAEFKAPRSKTVAPVQYSIMEVVRCSCVEPVRHTSVLTCCR